MITERREIQISSRLGVSEETEPLRRVLMWGAPGIEAVLGQLLPTDISCFQTQFDVMGARNEFKNAACLLEKSGTEVIKVKDLLAQEIVKEETTINQTLKNLEDNLKRKAGWYKIQYPQIDSKNVPVERWIKDILDEDAQIYGEKVAIIINSILSGGEDLPLSNVLYARDQSNLLGETFVWSKMKHPIRQPEVNLYRKAIVNSGLLDNSDIETVSVVGGGNFEGGDGIVSGGSVYVGVGGRTNITGILQIAPSILAKNRRLLIPMDDERSKGKLNEMDAMHLDTFWMPSGPKEIVACPDEVSRRRLLEVVWKGSFLKVIDRGWFADHLESLDVDIVPLTKDEQERYAPNFLNLGNGEIILSLSKGNNLTQELTKRGHIVRSANLENITKGFGGLHCMTAAIKRG